MEGRGQQIQSHQPRIHHPTMGSEPIYECRYLDGQDGRKAPGLESQAVIVASCQFPILKTILEVKDEQAIVPALIRCTNSACGADLNAVLENPDIKVAWLCCVCTNVFLCGECVDKLKQEEKKKEEKRKQEEKKEEKTKKRDGKTKQEKQEKRRKEENKRKEENTDGLGSINLDRGWYPCQGRHERIEISRSRLAEAMKEYSPFNKDQKSHTTREIVEGWDSDITKEWGEAWKEYWVGKI
ncbi:hypothetical protein QBC37DRAFT_487039 [Rhypophila decipiens]|uniref:Uncharacterized protein n=1 Tax=Rhypophila decipiens TaxID=261697 RepID=A0AAN6XYV2_9PEZI|nr:hypothetical protein QBC37DRAFT_487039 [Rhypophila decipiens]